MKTFAVIIKNDDGDFFNNTEKAKNMKEMIEKIKAYDKGKYLVQEIEPKSLSFKDNLVSFEPLGNDRICFGER